MTIRASFIGRLTRDSESKTTGDNQVCHFSVASDSGYGEKKTTQFIDCALWGNRGEKLHSWLLKGKQIVVYGEIGSREYERKEGDKGFVLTCRVNDVEFVGKKEDDTYRADGPTHNIRSTVPRDTGPYSNGPFDDSEVPF